MTISTDGVVSRISTPLNYPTNLDFLTQLTDSNEAVSVPPEVQPPILVEPTNDILRFYAQVVDQQENPVNEAKASCSIRVLQHLGDARVITTNLLTDSNGCFSLRVKGGQTLRVVVSKDNYVELGPKFYNYGLVRRADIHSPDSSSPVRFILRRNQDRSEFVAFKRGFLAPNTAGPVHLDLVLGRIVPEGGDLKLSVMVMEPYSNSKKYPWSLRLEAVNGGLIAIGNREVSEILANTGYSSLRQELIYEAPKEGYDDMLAYSFQSDSSDYRRTLKSWFYLKSRDGQNYSKLYLLVDTFWDERGVPFRIESVTNTNGSRNLQTVGLNLSDFRPPKATTPSRNRPPPPPPPRIPR